MRNPPRSAQIQGYSNGQSQVGFTTQGRAQGCPALPARLTRGSESWKLVSLERNQDWKGVLGSG